MTSLPAKATERIAANLKKYQPILASAKNIRSSD